MKLRPYEETDIPLLQQWIKLPQIQSAVNVSKYEPDKPYMFYFITKDNEEPIGAITLFNIEWNEQAEIGIAFVKNVFNKSLVKELINFVSLAFQVYRLKRVYAHHNGSKAEKFAEYFGFKNGVLLREDFLGRWF